MICVQGVMMLSDLLLFSPPSSAWVSLTGADRQTFLHSFSTNDIKRLQSGDVCEAFLPDVKGRILGHAFIIAEEDQLSLISIPAQTTLVPHLQKYLLGVEAEVLDRSEDQQVLCVVGSYASAALGFASELPLLQAARLTWEGPALMAARIPLMNLPTYLIYGQRDDVTLLQKQLLSRSVSQGTAADFERLRIEAGFLFVGIDISDANIAQEAARTAQCISFTKGCYLGQEPIARLDALGHTNRELRGLLIHSPQVVPGAILSSDGEQVGTLTSVASRDEATSVGLGMLRIKNAAPGTTLQVTLPASGEAVPAVVFWPTLDSLNSSM